MQERTGKSPPGMPSHPDGGFPAQQQDLPGSTMAMDPQPDHGEDSYVGHGRLSGLRALITGGDSGIGRAVSLAFAREGADVALGYLPEEQEDAENAAGWITDAGRRAVLCPGDLTEPTTCESLVQRAVDELGGLDIVVNNAGTQMARDDSLEEMSAERIDQTLKTNLYALILVTRAALPHLQSGSSIINVSSIQAYEPSSSLLDYAATKAGINNFTVNLAAEVGPRGIRVNAVAPGPIWTPLQPATQKTEKITSFGADTPLGRAGQPVECASAFVFLAAPSEAGYVSGTVVGVTGGRPVF